MLRLCIGLPRSRKAILLLFKGEHILIAHMSALIRYHSHLIKRHSAVDKLLNSLKKQFAKNQRASAEDIQRLLGKSELESPPKKDSPIGSAFEKAAGPRREASAIDVCQRLRYVLFYADCAVQFDRKSWQQDLAEYIVTSDSSFNSVTNPALQRLLIATAAGTMNDVKLPAVSTISKLIDGMAKTAEDNLRKCLNVCALPNFLAVG